MTMTNTAISADDIIFLLVDALKEFGLYTYEDKGADEVIDVFMIARRLADEHTAESAINVLKEVAQAEHADILIMSIVHSMENVNEGFLDEMFEVDEPFLSEHY